MKALPTQDRALAKRASLIQAGIRAFSKSRYEAVTAKTIAANAGVATGTFYQYFENKSDILQVIALERYEFLQQHIEMLELREINHDASSIVEHKFERILTFVYEFHAHAPELHQVLEQRRVADDTLRQIMRDGEAVIKERVLNFVQSFNMPNAVIVSDNLFAMAEGIVHRLVFERPSTEPEVAIRMGAQMLASYFKP